MPCVRSSTVQGAGSSQRRVPSEIGIHAAGSPSTESCSTLGMKESQCWSCRVEPDMGAMLCESMNAKFKSKELYRGVQKPGSVVALGAEKSQRRGFRSAVCVAS